MRSLRHLFTAAALAAAASCGGGGGGDGGTAPPPADNTPASISISPAGAQTLQSGAQLTLTAAVKAKDGHTVSTSVLWSTSDATVIGLNGGTLTGLAIGTATITASTSGISASTTVTVTVGSPVQLTVRTQPVGSVIGSKLATQPVIDVRDAAGNLITNAAVPVTVSIANGGGTLTGQTTVTSAGGVATFTDLGITGTAGNRTLAFASPGLATATSATVVMTPPAIPILQVDNATVSIAASSNGAPVARVVQVTNGGSVALTGLATVITYDAGQPTGWLNATLSSATAPATLTLSGTPGTLAAGSYHATVSLSAPGATNSPLSISVTLTVTVGSVVTYGTATEKVRVVDIGATFAPAVSVTDSSSRPITGVATTFASRSPSVASVAADGRITAVAAGDAWVVFQSAASSDSVFVIVPRSATAPLFRTTGTTWVGKAQDTTSISIVLDGRGTTIGAASVSIGVQLYPTVFTNFLYSIPSGPPTPTVAINTGWVVRASFGTAAGVSGPVTVLNLKIVGGAAGGAGWITLLALDVSGIDGSDLTPITTSTRFPIVLK